MCCIFTCFGWLIDVVQRCWTFTMSCCISSAVCCALITASMSGVALGYNYSLAEYIELKETNVSVFLKRGVFDDEVVDELDWRRSGGGAAAQKAEGPSGLSGEAPEAPTRMPPISPDEDMPVRSGRRLDDAILQSDETNRFEGALMKLTARPFDLASNSPPTYQTVMNQLNDRYVKDSFDDMRAIQGMINSRRKVLVSPGPISENFKPNLNEEFADGYPGRPPPVPGDDTRRRLFDPPPVTMNFLRLQVPGVVIPGVPIEPPKPGASPYEVKLYRMPPTRPPDEVEKIRKLVLSTPSIKVTKHKPTTSIYRRQKPEASDYEVEDSKENLDPTILKTLNEPEIKEYEEDDVKGLPMRRRRRDTRDSIKDLVTSDSNLNLSKEGQLEMHVKKKNEDNQNQGFNFLEKIAVIIKNLSKAFTTDIKSETSKASVITFPASLSTESITKSINGIESTSVKTFLLKIVKSTVVAS